MNTKFGSHEAMNNSLWVEFGISEKQRFGSEADYASLDPNSKKCIWKLWGHMAPFIWFEDSNSLVQ